MNVHLILLIGTPFDVKCDDLYNTISDQIKSTNKNTMEITTVNFDWN